MLNFGLIDDKVKEPLGGAHTDPEKMAKTLKAHIKAELAAMINMDRDERINQRIQKYRTMGRYDIAE